MDIEEAIERLKYINMAYDCNNYYSRYDLDCIETALNLIQTQQAELEKKDKQIEQYQNMLATNDMLHVLECEKKDKIIDEMAIYINNFDIDEDICKKVDEPCKNYAGENGKLCNECIIKYFTKKVEKEGK